MIPRLTHWGRVTHICVNKLWTIGSDNDLSPGRRQAIIWNNVGILFIGHLGTNFSENQIEIITFSFKKMRLKMSSWKWRPFCLSLNAFNQALTTVSMSLMFFYGLNTLFCHGYFGYVFSYHIEAETRGRHFADDTFKCIFFNENVGITIKISLKFVPNGPINNIPTVVQIMAWRHPGDKPLSEPMITDAYMRRSASMTYLLLVPMLFMAQGGACL